MNAGARPPRGQGTPSAQAVGRGEQRQTTTTNPRLYEAMEMFDMGREELAAHLQEQMYANPCLELWGAEEEYEGEEDDEFDAEDEFDEPLDDLEADPDDPEAEFDWEEIIRGDYEPGGARPGYEPLDYAESAVPVVPDLHDRLEEQLALLSLRPEIAAAALEIAGNVDDDGRLSCTLEDVAESLGQDDLSVLEEALEVVQSLDPPGVGARSLRECLAIQLGRAGREDSLAYRLVGQHFDDLINHRWIEISKSTSASPEELQKAKDEIAELDPRPGRTLSDAPAQYIVPDLIVEKVDGKYVVSSNERGMPRLRVSPAYRDVVEMGKYSGENRKFIVDRMNAAKWLVDTLEQRRQNMLAVMQFILDTQQEFFEQGPEFLKPLTLRMLATEVGIAESTASRLTSKKYVQTPRGVFRLRYFFSRGVASENGEVSTHAVKAKIKSLVDSEDPVRPLTDQAIVELLRHEGTRVARRTVAKYRTELHIPVARARRRY